MIKFKSKGDKIIKVEVEKETAGSVWVAEKNFRGELQEPRRRAKITDYECYHDSWKAAKDYLVGRAQERVKGARRQLENENCKLGNLKGMKEPVDAAQ